MTTEGSQSQLEGDGDPQNEILSLKLNLSLIMVEQDFNSYAEATLYKSSQYDL